MKLCSTVSDNPVDELCQIRDELRVVWLALGNHHDGGHFTEVREHINGLESRLSGIVEHLIGRGPGARVASARNVMGGRQHG